MIYHVTLRVANGRSEQSLTSAIEGEQMLNSVVGWIQRARRRRSAEPMIYWVTLDGKRWCLAPADLVGRIEVHAQPEPAGITGRADDSSGNVKSK